MNITDLVEDAGNHPVYRRLAVDNLDRQYGFLKSIVLASLGLKRDMFSMEVIKALNYHAMACLHATAGELRPWGVKVGKHKPPPHYRVAALMAMFVDEVNRKWEKSDPIFLAAFVLWKLNHIHPFVDGNGRTARAACYFVLCLKLGRWLEGVPNLPELIRDKRAKYIKALEHATSSLEKQIKEKKEKPEADLRPLQDLLTALLLQQRESADKIPILQDAEAAAALPVGDLARARRFYEDVLGLSQIEEESDSIVVYRSGGGLRFILYGSKAGPDNRPAVTWRVGDKFEEAIKELAAKGVAFEHYDAPGLRREGDVHHGGGARAAWFKDPDGNILHIVSR